MDKSKVKSNIRKARRAAHLSQEEMAARMGISRNAFRNLEAGETKVSTEHVTKIAKITGTSEEAIYFGDEGLAVSLLEAGDGMKEKLKALTDDYEARLGELRAKLTDKELLIDSLNHHIATLESMVSMLERQVSRK